MRSSGFGLGLLAAGLLGGCRTAAPPDSTPAPISAAPAGAAVAADEEPTAAARVAATAALPALPLPDAPELAWWRESMQTREQRLGWWREARFGMFVHWGVYSMLGGVWEGKPVTGYAEHIQRIRKIPRAVYRERVAGQFNPREFDAEAWMTAAKDAGMGYFIITAKHHDGFAMYDSAVGDYDVVEATPWKQDPMRALAAAARKHGIKFGFYYSHAFDWGEAVGIGNDWEHANPGGDRNLHGGRDWWLTAPQFLPIARRYVDEKAIPQLEELITRYDPDILWFDTPHKLPPWENLRILRAVRAKKPSVVVNGRIVQAYEGTPPARFGDYASTADRPAEFPPQAGDWEGIPTTNESYGWHQHDRSHKTAAALVTLLVKAAARGGNLLLNVGPTGAGRIDAPDAQILTGIAAWMKTNRESIVGTTRTPLPVQGWGESTRKDKTLYLHVFAWPQAQRGRATLLVGGLKSTPRRAYLLADPKRRPLVVRREGDLDLAIELPAAAPDPTASVIALELADEPVVDGARVLRADLASDTLRAFDAQISPGLRYGAGKTRDAWVHGWSRADAWVRWPVRTRQRGRFAVAASYDAPGSAAGGRFEIRVAGLSIGGIVAETPPAAVPVGEVELPRGAFDLEVRGVEIKGEELFRLRGLVLRPIP